MLDLVVELRILCSHHTVILSKLQFNDIYEIGTEFGPWQNIKGRCRKRGIKNYSKILSPQKRKNAGSCWRGAEGSLGAEDLKKDP